MKLEEIKKKYDLEKIKSEKEALEERMGSAHRNPSANMSQISAELAYISDLYLLVDSLYSAARKYDEAQQLIAEGDTELGEMARAEVADLEPKIAQLDEQITQKEIEKKLADPDDMKSVILEIRPGAGGEEAALFGADLFRMYKAFSDMKGWNMSVIENSVSENGGIKYLAARIEGRDVFKHLKYESGVHRVQRIPATESGGRIHTSTASVAILPEAEDVEIEIDEKDLKVEVMRASGAGGQHVNKTSSAIRITHIPTGIFASSQESRVQQENRKLAMQMLKARLYEQKREEEARKRSDMRHSQIGSAMRSEKIRTYNYPQSRITDHRVKASWHNLEAILNGYLDEVVEEVNRGMMQQMLDELKD
ncbi:MAG: peptide chain release factor 1 [Candidatus Dojkabacteria bacterium]|nr:MAG: peptide chain release factor 1 [Candidatus Dojkabacteria bacterium]